MRLDVITIYLLIPGGEHLHSHDDLVDHPHESHSGRGHSHTLKDLSVGISVLGKRAIS